METCSVCGKELPVGKVIRRIIDGKNMTLCAKHVAQYNFHGKFLDSSPFTQKLRNRYEIKDDIAIIYTTNNTGEQTGFFIIDKEDLDKVIPHKWRVIRGRYCTNIPDETGKIHVVEITRFLFPNNPKGYDVDHINHKPWDNRRSNLRVITHAENIRNQSLKSNNVSGIAGVGYSKKRNKWTAEIKYNYKSCKIGRFSNIYDACFARFYAEYIMFGNVRNSSNDSKLLPLVRKCENKKIIQEIVMQRLYKIFIKPMEKDCVLISQKYTS